MPPGPGTLLVPNPRRFIRQALVFEGALVVLAFALGWLFSIDPFSGTALTAKALGLGLAASVPPLLGLYLINRSRLPALVRLRHYVTTLLGPAFEGATFWHIVALALLAGVGEEALFRGVLQPAATVWVGPVVAVLVTSLLFGLVHFLSLSYAALATVAGLYLGILQVVSGNLVIVIIVHALYDAVALRLLALDWTKQKGQQPGPVPGGPSLS